VIIFLNCSFVFFVLVGALVCRGDSDSALGRIENSLVLSSTNQERIVQEKIETPPACRSSGLTDGSTEPGHMNLVFFQLGAIHYPLILWPIGLSTTSHILSLTFLLLEYFSTFIPVAELLDNL
jgi:hypothetical protein